MLLIHTCCADCTLKLLASFKADDTGSGLIDKQQTSFFYYAPNIHPRSEYFVRLEAFKKIISQNKLLCKLIIPAYKPQDFFANLGKWDAKNLPKAPARCQACWQLRLKRAFIFAKENNYSAVSTTMLVSSYMNVEQIKKIGSMFSRQYNLPFIVPKKICSDLKTRGFFKQNYCGCVFSMLEKVVEKYA